MQFKTVLITGFLFLCSNVPASAALPIQAVDSLNRNGIPTLAPMLSSVTPAVVNISTRGWVENSQNSLLSDPFFQRFFNIPSRPRTRETQSLGSGVVVDRKNGYILTNYHVIQNADEITVTLRDRRNLSAKVIGSDPETDIAVIQVESDNLIQINMADSQELQVGDFVVAIGNPFGLGQTVTSGIVSALGRSGLGIEGYEDFIQTDASINPGNSGGALVNLKGQLIGINTAILSPGGGGNVGIGFAIPINMANDIMQQLIESGEVRRGKLGITLQDLTPELARAFGLKRKEGAVISQVLPGSPADRAGLKSGDVVVSVDDRPVSSSADLHNLIGLNRAGLKVKIGIIRNGKNLNLHATITAIHFDKIRGEQIAPLFSGAILGIIAKQSSWAAQNAGIQVLNIEENTAAYRAGLRKGDSIVSVNRQRINSFTELRQAVEAASKGVLLNILRNGEGLFLLIR